MKIELVEIKDQFGDGFWQTEVDGEYVSGSVSVDFDQAKERYNSFKRTKSKSTRKVIESVTI